MAQSVFERIEKKYIITQEQYRALQTESAGLLTQDQYGLHTIGNLYMDTEDFALIRASIEKPVYKEKLRLRCYGIPQASDTVFLELKKKYKGVVYKRRIPMTLAAAMEYLLRNTKPRRGSQILREIDWFRQRNSVSPQVYLAYDRVALFGAEDPCLRVTFDENIRWRTSQLDLSKGSWGTELLDRDTVVMEVKVAGAIPVWLTQLLSALSITPASFSKYGTVYKQNLLYIPGQMEEFAHVS